MLTKRWFSYACILGAIWLVFGLSLGNERIGDDSALLQMRLDPGNVVDAAQLWQENYWGALDDSGLYRPLALTLLYAERLAFGLTEWPYRAVNLLLYSLCCILCFSFLSQFTGRIAALAAALLFAVHPAHVEVVVTAYGQVEMLASILVLAALAAHVKSVRNDSLFWTAIAAAAYLGALLSKESAVCFPVLAALTRGFWIESVPPAKWRWFARRDALYLGALAIYAAMKISTLDVIGTPDHAATLSGFSLTRKVFTIATNGLGNYVRLSIFPESQSIIYDVFNSPLADACWVLAGILLLLLSARILGTKPVYYAAAWFAATWFIFSNLVVPTGVFVAERCLFLPIFAVCFLFGLYAERAATASSRIFPALLALILILCAAQSTRTAWNWRTEESSLRASIAEHPLSPEARSILALTLLLKHNRSTGDSKEATTLLNAVLERFPGVPEAHRGLGLAAKARGDFSGAIGHLRRAIELRPRDVMFQQDLAECERLAAGPP